VVDVKLRQSIRHFAAKQALTAPVLGPRARDWLVDLHVRIFADRADPAHRAARRPRLEAFFDGTMDAYVAALEAGYPEAEAREITHIQANLDFANHGWTEMLEIPLDELDAHLERYADFFDAHGIGRADPLGDFRTRELPDAPSTLDRLEDGEAPRAEGGYADDAYVQTPDGEVTPGGSDEPDEVDPTDVLGLDDESAE
jgi:hypothetical protein